jgi:hypothetical protein
MCAVRVVKVPVAGSYSSAVLRSTPPASWPPSISTVSSKLYSIEAVASVRAWLRFPASVTVLPAGLKISALLSGPDEFAPPAIRTVPSESSVAV